MFKSIKLKILIPVLVITILSMVGKTVYDYIQFKNEISTNINTIISEKMNSMQNTVNSKLDLWQEDMNMLAATEAVKSMDWSKTSSFISDNKDLFSKYEMLLLSDMNGNANTNSGTAAINIADRAYFKKAIQGVSVVSDPVVSKASGKVVIVVVAPVKGAAGNVVGVVGGTIEITDIANVINSQKLGNSGYAFMTNKEGTVIVHNNKDLILKENYLKSSNPNLVELTKKMIAAEKGTMTYKFEGKDKIAAYAPIESTGWSIAMTGIQQELFKALFDMRTKAIWLTIILLIPLVAIIYFVVNTITKSIKKLTAVSDKLAVGNMNVSIDVKSQDEVGKLADSFKKMVENIKEQAIVSKDIADGNLDTVVKEKSEDDILSKSMNLVVQTLKELVDESQLLTNAAVEGKLDIRGNTDKFKGGYQNIVQGVNSTLDAVIEPIKESTVVLQEMANGNLQVSVKGNYKGDHAEIKDALNKSIKSFNEVLRDINSAADQVASGAKQVSDSSQSLSQGTTEQASSIEEITASVTQIAAQTKQNAVNANQANELSVSAKDNAISGNVQMKEMQKAMTEINEASVNISKIIKVIDEIAFQTNILALNAAVEAARAGQHGKGFAVVAEEVRNLAARSASAAKETTALIEGSVKKVEAGTKIANSTAEALGMIVVGASQAADLVAEIASASNEQATGISQVNMAINQVSQVTQMNTATAEESAAASEELSSQAELLKDMINRFKLDRQDSIIQKEALSSEIIRMIETMVNKNSKSSADSGEYHAEAAAATEHKLKIALDDREFGKY